MNKREESESSLSINIPRNQVVSRVGKSPVTIGAMELLSDLPIGEIIPSIEAVDWINGHRNVDIRPRLIDSSSGEARLLDSGAQLSATQRKPEDKLDSSVNLVAVNGSIKEFRVFNYIVLLRMLGPLPAAYSCLSCRGRTPVISRAPILRKYTIKEDVSGGETSLYVGFHKTVQSTIVDFDVRLSQVNLSKNLAGSYTRFTLLFV